MWSTKEIQQEAARSVRVPVRFVYPQYSDGRPSPSGPGQVQIVTGRMRDPDGLTNVITAFRLRPDGDWDLDPNQSDGALARGHSFCRGMMTARLDID